MEFHFFKICPKIKRSVANEHFKQMMECITKKNHRSEDDDLISWAQCQNQKTDDADNISSK